MKKLLYLFIAVILITSCQKTDKDIVGNEVQFSGSTYSTLKSTLNYGAMTSEWIGFSDSIGIYSNAATVGISGPVASNAVFVAQQTGKNSTFLSSPASDKLIWGDLGIAHTFNAYYPQKGTTSVPMTTVPFNLPNPQICDPTNPIASVGKYDILVADPISKVVGDQNPINFTFKHACAVFRVSVTGTDYLDNIIVTGPAGSILSFTGTPIMNINENPSNGIFTITGGVSSATTVLKLSTRKLLSATPFVCYIVIYPNSLTSGSYTLTAKASNSGNGVVNKTSSTATGGATASYLPGIIYDIPTLVF